MEGERENNKGVFIQKGGVLKTIAQKQVFLYLIETSFSSSCLTCGSPSGFDHARKLMSILSDIHDYIINPDLDEGAIPLVIWFRMLKLDFDFSFDERTGWVLFVDSSSKSTITLSLKNQLICAQGEEKAVFEMQLNKHQTEARWREAFKMGSMMF